MSDDSRAADDVGDSDDERTTVVDRSAPGRSAPGRPAPDVEHDDEHEGTVVVDRGSREPADDSDSGASASASDRGNDDSDSDGDDERTTVVDRSSRAAANTAESSADDSADDNGNATVVVERPPSAADGDDNDGDDDNDNATLVVQRPARPAPSPETGDPDGTIVVARAGGSSGAAPAASPTRRGRRRITLPPVEPGFGPDPVDAVGPGAVAAYSRREIGPVPVGAPAVPLGPDATRAPAPSMPSVVKRSRAFGMIAVGGFALACTVSVVGLGAIIAAVVG